MLQDWENGLVGNNPGIVARMPRRDGIGRVVVNAVRGRLTPGRPRAELPSAA